MTIIRWIFLLLFSFSATLAVSQQENLIHPFYIHGWVKDSTFTNEIPNHWVYLKSNPPATLPIFDSCLTDQHGHFLFDSLFCYSHYQLDLDLYTYDCHHNKKKYHYWNYQPSITTFFGICVDQQTFCHAQFSWQLIAIPDNTVHFTDLSSQNCSFWIWDFGDGNFSSQQHPNHTYSQTGTYQVVLQIVDTTHLPYCFDSQTQQITILPVDHFHLGGQVFDGGFPEQDGSVYLYGEVPEGFMLFDSSMLNSNGVYYFYMIPEGNYLLKYIPLSSSPSSCFPTYHQQSLQWDQASLLNLNQDVFCCDINLHSMAPLTPGPGTITGKLQIFWNGNPTFARHEEIILSDQNGIALDYCFTDMNDHFEFHDLPLGTYYLSPDIPGLISNPVMVTIDNGHLTFNNVQIFAQNNPIGMEEPGVGFSLGLVYPNPTSGDLYLNLSSSRQQRISIKTYDLPGRCRFSTTRSIPSGYSLLALETNELSSGPYVLVIQTADNHFIRKKILITR